MENVTGFLTSEEALIEANDYFTQLSISFRIIFWCTELHLFASPRFRIEIFPISY